LSEAEEDGGREGNQMQAFSDFSSTFFHLIFGDISSMEANLCSALVYRRYQYQRNSRATAENHHEGHEEHEDLKRTLSRFGAAFLRALRGEQVFSEKIELGGGWSEKRAENVEFEMQMDRMRAGRKTGVLCFDKRTAACMLAPVLSWPRGCQ
jgi:hypothetical protein